MTSDRGKSCDPDESCPGNVYIVDDNQEVRLAIGALLGSCHLRYAAYGSAEEFMHSLHELEAGVALVDLGLPGKNGLELIEDLRRKRQDIRPVIVTGNGDLQTAIRALREGVADFLEKPFDEEELLRIVRRELSNLTQQSEVSRRAARSKRLMEDLSPREREVVSLLAKGFLNKQVADELGLSIRTVEMHRSRAMERLGVNSLADLLRIVFSSQLT